MTSYRNLSNGSPVDFSIFNTLFANEKELERSLPVVQMRSASGSTATSGNDHKIKIIGGQANIGAFKSASDITVKFGATHVGSISPVITATALAQVPVFCTVHSVTSTGFKIRVHPYVSSINRLTVNWTAIIEVAMPAI